jgi:dipeptidyl aminopeptidase/acylaminoacyl peptidase
MRKLALFLLTGCLFALSGPADRQVTDPKSIVSPANPNARPVPVSDLFATRGISDAAWSPAGDEIAIVNNLSGRFNLWKVAAAGSWPVQLIQSDDRQQGIQWSHDGKWIAFAQDKGGNELWDLYLISANGTGLRNLTNTPEVREQSPRWSNDDRQIAFDIKPKAAPSYDIAVLDVASGATRQLTHESDPQHSWSVVDWSPDARTIYANRSNVLGDDSDIYAIDVVSGNAVNLTQHSGTSTHSASSVSKDGRVLLIGSNEKGGYENVALLDVASKKPAWITDTQWEAVPGTFSPDGTTFTYTINQDGRADVYLASRSGSSRKLNMPAGVNETSGPQEFAADGRRILLGHTGSNTPEDLWIYDTRSNQPRQLTHVALASLTPENFPQSQIVHYKSFDGQMISAFLYMPFNLKRDGTNPVVLYPHGGPTGQTQDNFSRTIVALVSRGYIVVAPNPRGSTGYGTAFMKANFQDLGNGDLKDDMAGIQFAIDTGYADPKKIGVTGGSYGGYTTLMAIGKYPDKFAVAVDLFGPLDWFSMMKNSDPLLQQYIVGLLGDPEKNRQVYEDTSPSKYVPNIKAPLLVLQGENDPRVPKEETDQIIEKLKARGNIVDVHYYPAEGHGFAKRENQIDAIERTLAWFQKYLPTAATGTATMSQSSTGTP